MIHKAEELDAILISLNGDRESFKDPLDLHTKLVENFGHGKLVGCFEDANELVRAEYADAS